MNTKPHQPRFWIAGKRLAVLVFALMAINLSSQAETNSVETLCAQTKQFCDQMHATKSAAEQKMLAAKALDCAQRAVLTDTNSAKAHLCLAVSYVKNFPFVDTRTQVHYSRFIKTEAETAVRLDPNNDVSYYLLGRWHYGVANMNFIYKGLVKIIYGGLPKASNELALGNFQKAIRLAPGRIIHRLELAKLYHTTDQLELALAELKQCGALAPVDQDDTDAQLAAADILRTRNWPD